MKNFESKGKSLFCLGFLFISMLGTAVAQTFSGPGFTVQDGGGAVAASCSTVAVSGITNNVTVSSVTLSNANHTFIGDTVARIYPPTGTSFILAAPPDSTECNYGGTYTFTDSAPVGNFIDAAAAGCADNDVIPGGSYRTSNYGGGTAPGTVTSLTGFFGTLTPAQANGNWLVCLFDFATPDGGTVGSTSITFAGPTAAGISISGRVVTPTGNPIKDIDLTLTDENGNVQRTTSSISGEYVFEDLPAGTIYTITASGKKHIFNQPTQFFNGTQDYTGIDFVGYPISPTKFTIRSNPFPN